MNRGRRRSFLALVAAATSILPLVPTVTEPATARPSAPVAAVQVQTRQNAVTWQSAGDSYSSGEGVRGNRGACAQSEKAYGPQAATIFEEAHGGEVSNLTFTACTGHLVEDYFNARKADRSSLWDWSREQGGPERVDVITMSFGGNDIGFADVLMECLPAPDSFTEFLLGGLASGLTGCDVSEAELQQRISWLTDPGRAEGCDSRRSSGERYDCPLLLEDRRGSIVDFYYDVVTSRLTPRGRLVVVGYPRLFAPVSDWPGWVKVSCQGIGRGDTEKLGRLAEHLNDKLKEAVRRANEALGSERVLFVDVLADYAAGHHELCGSGETWLNGISVRRDTTSVRHMTSFHPKEAGHRSTAIGVAQLVAERLPDFLAQSDSELVGMARCEGQCSVTGRIPLDHPRWGAIEIVTIGPSGTGTSFCADRLLFAVDGTGEQVWDSGVSDGGCPWYEFQLAPEPVDDDGRIFLNWNPGRYNGVSVLSVTDEGFEDHGTLPEPDYATRFYSAQIVDIDSDGVYEIEGTFNDCTPSCAGGTSSTTRYQWDGSDFAPIPEASPTRCGSYFADSEALPSGGIYADMVIDITVVGMSCDDALLDRSRARDRPPLVYALVGAHQHASGVRTYQAAGFACTVTPGSTVYELYAEHYSCRGAGEITFTRYKDIL